MTSQTHDMRSRKGELGGLEEENNKKETTSNQGIG